jgi:GT2 family glycosyltransferase
MSDGGIWCCQLELAGREGVTGVTDRSGGLTQARVLVRLHGDPVGYLTTPIDVVDDTAALRQQARAKHGARIREHLAAEGLADDTEPAGPGCPNRVENGDLITVVVCTRDRAAELSVCLPTLKALTYEPLEFVIVDNAPTSDATRQLVMQTAAEDPRFRYVVEPRPGVSRARNRGLAEARGRYLAYTDDDVEVDPGWVQGLLRGFQRRPDVGCVTGLVCTAKITGGAEAYFDARTPSWSTRVEAEIFDLTSGRGGLYPYSAGVFGTGASFAFERSLLSQIGGFDEALGAGTLTKGGEDLDIFVRVLFASRAVVYEPSAVVWHHHRGDETALLGQLYGYGTGLSAFLTKLLTQRSTRYEVLRRIPRGLARGVHIKGETDSRLEAPLVAPPGAGRRELRGVFAGPLLYARSRRAVRRDAANPD